MRLQNHSDKNKMVFTQNQKSMTMKQDSVSENKSTQMQPSGFDECLQHVGANADFNKLFRETEYSHIKPHLTLTHIRINLKWYKALKASPNLVIGRQKNTLQDIDIGKDSNSARDDCKN